MQTNENYVGVAGIVAFAPQPITLNDVDYSWWELNVERKSGKVDSIRVINNKCENPKGGQFIKLSGRLVTYNVVEDGKSKLQLYILVDEIAEETNESVEQGYNEVWLGGFIVRQQPFRETPKTKRIVKDFLLACNYDVNKTAYLPCVFFKPPHNNFEWDGITKDNLIELTGRIESRDYDKKLENDKIETRRTYEIVLRGVRRAK